MIMKLAMFIALSTFCSSAALAYGNKANEVKAAAPKAADVKAQALSRQYTFAWKFIDGDSMAPRGGSTQGIPTTLAPVPSKAWQSLQAASSASEKDHAAILAMAGEYRVSFDFIEVAGFNVDAAGKAFQPAKPYQSWGTEKIYVIDDRAGFISLQHVLVMHIVTEPGKPVQTMLTKHWRQDWQFEPKSHVVYLGPHRWQQVPVSAAHAAGSWSQTVYQVDDSPRYSGVGRWLHQGNYSSWQGSEGLRPLPRREWSVRSDYQASLGTNRHTITPSGWVQEEQNNKVLLDNAGSLRAENPVLAREYGFNRYELISGSDFSLGDAYMVKTAALWLAVRSEWAARLNTGNRISLKAAPDQGALYLGLFERAETVAADADAAKLKVEVKTMLDAYLSP